MGAKSTLEKRDIDNTEVLPLLLRVNPNVHHPVTLPIQINNQGTWLHLGSVSLERGVTWVDVKVDWEEGLSVWEKNLIIQSIVKRNPNNFKIWE